MGVTKHTLTDGNIFLYMMLDSSSAEATYITRRVLMFVCGIT